MHNYLFLLLLLFGLSGCGGDNAFDVDMPNAWHTPEIDSLSVNPETVLKMQGDGSVVLTAQLHFIDFGSDISMLWLTVTGNGVSEKLQFSEATGTENGTISEDFDLSTIETGAFEVEVWVADAAGQASNHLTKTVWVIGDAVTWSAGDADLPFVLNAVHWSGENFYAVGSAGTILTSPDGLTWTERDSGTDADLYAIGFDLFDHVVVGDSATVLGSAGGIDEWFVQHSGDPNVSLRGVSHAWSIVAVGRLEDTGAPYVLRSPDHGQTWAEIAELPQSGRSFTSVAWGWADGLDVATTQIETLPNDARVAVSDGGEVWSEIVIDLDPISTYAVIWDGDRYWAGGGNGRLYRSPDGVNWTMLQTPVDGSLKALGWSGVSLVAHGSPGPVVTTSDGGLSWQTVDIADDFESHGVAYGAGRFVAVGHSASEPDKGAIYTSP